MDIQRKGNKKQLSRKYCALSMVFLSVSVSGLIGLVAGAIFHDGGFLRCWLDWSMAVYVLFCAGGTLGGILMLILPEKVDDDFCEKAGYGLYYGTLAVTSILKYLLDLELTLNVIGISFVICILICTIVWYKRQTMKGEKV